MLRRSTYRGGILLVVTLALMLTSCPVRAQDSGDINLSVEVGFDSRCVENHWTQVRVILENKGADRTGQVEANLVSFSGQKTIYAAPVDLPGISRKEILLYVYPDGHRGEMGVLFVEAGEQVAAQTVLLSCTPSSDLMIGLWASSPTAFYALAELAPAGRAPGLIPIDVRHIPEKTEAMNALDILVISGVDTGELNQAQRESLAGWLAQGGRLLVAGGAGWQKTAAGIENLLPLQPQGSITLPNLNPLVPLAHVESEQASLDGSALVAIGAPVEGAQIIASFGEAGQESLPLVLQRRIGAGRVVYLAADPALVPMNGWVSSGAFFHNLLGGQVDLPSWNSGVVDGTFANLAASRIPALDLPPGLLICGFLGLYVLSAGPLNYYVLRKLKRRELAWLSVPALVIVFSGLSILLGNFMRGGQPVLNKLSVVQIRPGTSEAQVDGIVGIFSPGRGTYQLQAGSGYLVHPLRESESEWNLVQSHMGTSIPDVRIEGGSISVLVMQGQTPAPPFSHTLTLRNAGSGSRSLLLTGSITNNSSLTLEDALLLAPGGSQALGELSPGETRQVSLPLTRSQQGNSPTVNMPGIASSTVPQIYGYEDPSITEITGSSAIYENPQAYTRYHLLKSVSSSWNSRGGGVYLSGWTDESPLQVGFEGPGVQRFISESTSLYLISFQPLFETENERIVLPPAAFSWALLESNSYTPITPYELSGISGNIILEYWLAQSIPFKSVGSLLLQLDSLSGSSPPQFPAYLWDFQAQDWQRVLDLKWGSNDIPDPARYVGPGGRIRLKIDSSGTGYAPINAADFTLVVER